MNFTIGICFYVIDCCKCGFLFGVDERVNNRWIKDHTSFYCPKCGTSQSYTSESEAEKLKKQLEYQKSRNAHLEEQAEHYKNSAKAFKGHNTRIKKRIGKGVCPCCNRTFENLAKHMNTKHPDYSEQTP